MRLYNIDSYIYGHPYLYTIKYNTYFKVSQFHFQGNVKTDDPINLRPDVDNLESSTDEESSDDESEDKKVEKKKDGIYRLDKTKMRPMLPPDSVQSAEDRALQKAKKRCTFGWQS